MFFQSVMSEMLHFVSCSHVRKKIKEIRICFSSGMFVLLLRHRKSLEPHYETPVSLHRINSAACRNHLKPLRLLCNTHSLLLSVSQHAFCKMPPKKKIKIKLSNLARAYSNFCKISQKSSRFFSSPELKAQGELIVWDSSRRPSVRPSTLSNMNISETSWPIII